MSAEDDPVQRLATSRQRRLGPVIGLGIGLVVGGAVFGWLFLVREPSPEATCETIAGHMWDDDDSTDGPSRLRSQVASGLAPYDDREGIAEACVVYFEALREENPERSGYGAVARCIALTWSAHAAWKCIVDGDIHEPPAREAMKDYWRARGVIR